MELERRTGSFRAPTLRAARSLRLLLAPHRLVTALQVQREMGAQLTLFVYSLH
jgi:hypothetical protein